jgi:hypothetical protein
MSNKGFNSRRSHLSGFLTWCMDNDLMTGSEAKKLLAGVRERPNVTMRPKTFVKAGDVPAVLKRGRAVAPARPGVLRGPVAFLAAVGRADRAARARRGPQALPQFLALAGAPGGSLPGGSALPGALAASQREAGRGRPL